jgi:hypothetical protein
MRWQDQLTGDSLPWLLDADTPDARFLALRDLMDCPPDDPELANARAEAHQHGPIATILDAMDEEGYWVKPGPGYGPKYTSTVWAMTLLAQLGASVHADERVTRACGYVLDHALCAQGQFSYNRASGGTFDCLQGNLCAALLDLGCDDPRINIAFDWMARTVTGEGLAPATERKAERRYTAHKSGPGFACGANSHLPCGWGAAKVMLAFSKLPLARRTPLIDRAITYGVAFLFNVDPATAAYPMPEGNKPSRVWWQFGFPVFYITDVLQIAEALAGLGLARDPRLASTLDLIRGKQDEAGRWPLEYSYGSKTWGNFGRKGTPNKWVTLRALRVLKAAA